MAHHLLFRKWHPLLISDFECKTINIDFMIEFPKSIVFNAIIIVVDFISKKIHFILTHNNVTVKGTARLLLCYI